MRRKGGIYSANRYELIKHIIDYWSVTDLGVGSTGEKRGQDPGLREAYFLLEEKDNINEMI